MATYEVKQGINVNRGVQDAGQVINFAKFYIVDISSGKVKEGPFPTEAAAQARMKELEPSATLPTPEPSADETGSVKENEETKTKKSGHGYGYSG
jgi:hypothetical protein